MQATGSSRQARAAYVAYVAAVLFAIRFVFFFLPPGIQSQVGDGTVPGALLSLAEHLVMFPIIAALPAPQWAKAAGYGWLVVDMSTDIMAFNHVPNTIYLALRYGDHLSAAVWIAVASWQARGAIRVIGLLYVLNLASYSYLAAYGVSPAVLAPSAILFPTWLVLVGRRLARPGMPQKVQAEASSYGAGG